MKKKNWIVFKLATYTALIFGLLMGIFLVRVVLHSTSPVDTDWLSFSIAMLVPISQVVFQVMNATLISRYLPGAGIAAHSAKVWHSIFLALNMLCVLAIFGVFISTLNDFIKYRHGDGTSFTREDYISLGLMLFIVAINLYTIIASLSFRKYLVIHHRAAEDQLLNSIGNDPDASRP